MNLDTIKEKLRKKTFNPKAFLNKMKFVDEAGRDSAKYTDSNFIPFYYFLGQEITPQKVIELGFGSGLISGTFFSACKSIETFLAFQQKTKEYYSPRLGRANVWNTLHKKFDFHCGNITDDEFIKKLLHHKWDCVLFNDAQDYEWYMDAIILLWDRLNLGATLVFSNINSHKPANDAYKAICATKNRDAVILPTRYGVGLLER